MVESANTTTALKTKRPRRSSKDIVPEQMVATPGFMNEELRQTILKNRAEGQAKADAEGSAKAKKAGRLQ
jgi:hypothetical protein